MGRKAVINSTFFSNVNYRSMVGLKQIKLKFFNSLCLISTLAKRIIGIRLLSDFLEPHEICVTIRVTDGTIS